MLWWVSESVDFFFFFLVDRVNSEYRSSHPNPTDSRPSLGIKCIWYWTRRDRCWGGYDSADILNHYWEQKPPVVQVAFSKYTLINHFDKMYGQDVILDIQCLKNFFSTEEVTRIFLLIIIDVILPFLLFLFQNFSGLTYHMGAALPSGRTYIHFYYALQHWICWMGKEFQHVKCCLNDKNY